MEVLLNRREAKKAKSGITLLHQACMFERAITHSEFYFAAVFGNDLGMRSENRTAPNAAKKIKRAGIFVLGLVRWVEKDEVDRLRQFAKALQHGSYTTVFQGESVANLQRGEIVPKSGQRRLGIFGEPDVLCTAAQRFDSNRPGAGIKIDEATAVKTWRKDIEEGFAQAIAGRTRPHATRGGQLTGAERTGNDAHLKHGKLRR